MFTLYSWNFKVLFSKRWDNGSRRKEVIPIALQYRHEWKHEISRADLMALRPRLRAVLTPDSHGAGGKYTIRSLYFDDPWDTALRQKLDGVDRRDKFRIRLYDMDTSVIHLEKKSKRGTMGGRPSGGTQQGDGQQDDTQQGDSQQRSGTWPNMGGFDTSQLPEGFDPSTMFGGGSFDMSQLPEGMENFDPSQMPGGMSGMGGTGFPSIFG